VVSLSTHWFLACRGENLKVIVSKGKGKINKKRGLQVIGHQIEGLNVFSVEHLTNQTQPAHCHPNGFEIVFVSRGRICYETSEGNFNVAEGNLIFFPKGVVHKPVPSKGSVAVVIRNSKEKILV